MLVIEPIPINKLEKIMDCTTIWSAVQERLITKLDSDTYQRYLSGIVPLSFYPEKNQIILGVLNDFVALWLDSNYKEIIVEVLEKVLSQRIDIKFEPGHDINLNPQTNENKNGEKVHIRAVNEGTKTGPLQYRPDFTFDSFVIGNNNRICHAAALAVTKKPGKTYNPLFIYGGVGLGKTHLLQAVANEVTKTRKRTKIKYLTSEEFVNLYVEAMQKKCLPAFRRQLRSLDFLIIDDVQFFEGKVGSSEEFFHTFNTLHNTHKQMILASDRNPQDIQGMEQRLVSRFEWGLSAEILMPDLETRVAILKKKQERHTIKISDEILFLIAGRIGSNIRNLEGALTKLIMNISAFGGEMTVERAESLLKDKFESESSKLISIDTIQRKVADFYDIRLADMMSKKRPANIALPRMVAMYLTRQLTDNSLPSIGDAFNRNHATVIHAVDTIENRMESNASFKHTIGKISRKLHNFQS